LLAGGLAYANSLDGPLIFDDRAAIVDNVSIRQLRTAWRPDRQTPVAGRPIANLSFAANYAFGGETVQGYHAVNVAIHVTGALLLFGLLRRMLARTLPPESSSPGSSGLTATDWLAWFIAGAWLLHPLNTEAVDYVTQRTESLAGLFTLLTVYLAARAWESPAPWRWELAAVAASLVGIGTKESMVVTPILVVLCDAIFGYASVRDALARRWPFYLGLTTCWLVFLVQASSTPFFAERGFATEVSRWTYLLNQGPIILRYLRLSIWPTGLVVDYGVPETLTLAEVWPGVAAVGLLLVAAIVALVRRPKVGFWGAWFFLTLAPASSIVPIPTEVGAERRMYLPLVAIIVLLVLGARRLAALDGFAFLRRAALPIGGAILVALGAVTVARNTEYRDPVVLWQTVLDRRPHTRAHANLAAELRLQGRIDDSIAHLRIAAPDDANALHALGSALLERGEAAQGVMHLQAFVERYPDDPHIYQGYEELAAGLFSQGRTIEAVEAMQRVVSAQPDYAQGRFALANLLLSSERFKEAAAEYGQVLRIQPQHAVARTRLGLALATAGDIGPAVEALQRAIAANPRDIDAVRMLVDLRLRQQRFAEAEQEARRAVTASPQDARAHSLLGIALAAAGRQPEAIASFRSAVGLDPQLEEAQDGLARLTGSSRAGR
jgi:Flp pilus assembly protein TadD